jgi:hypothetical protein
MVCHTDVLINGQNSAKLSGSFGSESRVLIGDYPLWGSIMREDVLGIASSYFLAIDGLVVGYENGCFTAIVVRDG